MAFGEADARSSTTQLLPPLLLALPLLATRGTPLLLGVLAVAVAFLWSATRLLRLLARRDGAARRLRSVLVVALAPAVLAVAWLQVAPVPGYLNGLAAELHKQCRAAGQCPARIAGWDDLPGDRGSSAEMGGRVRYDVDYRTDGRTFAVCWRTAFGACRSARGSVDGAFEPMRSWPWPEAGRPEAAALAP